MVREVKLAAEDWVKCECFNLPGFLGAFLAGSVTTLPDGMPLPVGSDVDITVVTEDPPERKLGKFRFRGVLLEVSFEVPKRFQSPEAVLEDPHLAGGIQGMQVVADPSGFLGRLQGEVAGEYARRRCVRQRCRTAVAMAEARLHPFSTSAPLHDRVTAWLFGTSLTALTLLLAGLRPPTVRRRYAEVRGLLRKQGRLDFHEELLRLLGCSDWSRSRTERHLDAVSEAFDRAKHLPKGAFPFGADISDAARPVAIDGSRELIEEGFHREAVFWLLATYSRCQWIFHFNAFEHVEDHFQQGYLSLLGDLGIGEKGALESRRKRVLNFLPQVTIMAESVMDATPEIK